MNAAAANDNAKVYPVAFSKREATEEKLSRFARTRVRHGLPALAWTWGQPYALGARVVRRGPERRRVAVPGRTMVPLTVRGDLSHGGLGGWALLGRVEHHGSAGDLVLGEIPADFRGRGPVCDHCGFRRPRSSTFVIRHDGGRTAQIGKSCLSAYLGSDAAARMVSAAEFLALASDAGESEEGYGGGRSSEYALCDLLPWIAQSVRVQGWRKSGSAPSTLELAIGAMHEKVRRLPSEADKAEAKACLEWLASEIANPGQLAASEYGQNLLTIARIGYVPWRGMGLAASAIVAYQRSIAQAVNRAQRASRESSHVGTIGKREVFSPLTLDFVTGYATDFGYTTILKFADANGNTLVWKASNTEISRADIGRKYTVTGTVKAHDDYKGAKQTSLSRCKVVEVEA